MSYRTAGIILTILTAFSVTFLSSCTFEAKGIPVTEFRPAVAAEKADVKQKKRWKKKS